MVSAAGLEPATHALKGFPNLDWARPIATKCHRCLTQQGFPEIASHLAAPSQVWWRAQNRAQSFASLLSTIWRPRLFRGLPTPPPALVHVLTRVQKKF